MMGETNKKCTNVDLKLVLWGQSDIEFNNKLMYDNGQRFSVVGISVGVLKSYNSESFFGQYTHCLLDTSIEFLLVMV
jgi:hypothetical protein